MSCPISITWQACSVSAWTRPRPFFLAGESYRSIYEMLSNQTPSGRNGKKGFTDYSQAYPRLGIPVSLVSCDDTGAMQLAIMRQMDYRTRIAQAAFGARWKPEDDRLPEADGHVDGNPLVIAVDMDLRRLERGLPRRVPTGTA